jgi:hypothetical protein
VLEHLDRGDAVETAVGVEDVRVGRDHLDVGGCPRADELALHRRVGDREDARAGIALGEPQRERAPAAAEIEDLHPVLDPRAAAGQVEHRLFRVRERFDPGRPVARAVLHARTEDELEELGRQLVVLLVRLLHLLGDRRAAEAVDEGPALRGSAAALAPQPQRARSADPGTEEGVAHADLGGNGINALVSRW